jgi:FkbM family methyltransferase
MAHDSPRDELPLKTRLADATVRRLFFGERSERSLLRLHERHGWQFALKGLPAHYSYPTPTWRIAERNGIVYRLDIGTYGGWCVYGYRSSNWKIGKLLQPGQNMVDIGANLGEVALSCAKRVQPGGKVFAFEPNPAAYELLAANLELNSGLPCQPIPLALGAIEGTVQLRLPDHRNNGTVTIDASGISFGGYIGACSMETLDGYADRVSLPKIHLVKIDVEGYESAVLNGAKRCIDRWRPLLVLELVDSLQRVHGRTANDLAEWLREQNYAIEDFHTGRKVGGGMNLEGCQMDVLCLPDGRKREGIL